MEMTCLEGSAQLMMAFRPLVGGGVSVPLPGLSQHIDLKQFLGIHLRTDALGSHGANPEAEEW